jgi:hypothetical protein
VPSLETHGNLFLSKRFQIEALEWAVRYNNPQRCVLCFNDKDLNDPSNGNLIGKIKVLVDEGFIAWEYSDFEKQDSKENYYQIDKMRLTIKGENLLKSYSVLSKFGPTMIGIVSTFIATYLAFKAGIL